MSKEKQIEEMAKILCPCYETDRCDIGCDRYYGCSVGDDATDMYNAGYRKQSEGEWVWKSNGYMKYLHCSCCGNQEDWERKYCANCGAKMKGGEE